MKVQIRPRGPSSVRLKFTPGVPGPATEWRINEGTSRFEYRPQRSNEPWVEAPGSDFEGLIGSLTTGQMTFLQNGAGAVDRSVLSKLRERVSAKDFGAKGDGVTDDSAALQKWLTYISANNVAGYLPAGRYYKPNNTPSLTFSGNCVIFGDGMHSSVIVFNDDVIVTRSDLINTTTGGNLLWCDFGIEGSWGNGGDYAQRSQLVQITLSGTAHVTRCRFAKSRYMSLILGSATKATVLDCEFAQGFADGCRITGSDNVIVAHNQFQDINDDAIAIHSKDAEVSPVQGGVVVTGNRIIDSQGIAVLGAKHCTISNNVLNRCIVRGILVGVYSAGGTEGTTAGLAINITGNTVTDMFFGTAFSGLNGGAAQYIYVASIPPTMNGSGFVGQRDGIGGIVQPFDYFYANDTDATAPHPGNWFINVSDNICARTLKPVSAYSQYGFGLRLSRGGPVDPAISAVQLGSGAGQIIITNHTQHINISNNQLWGGGYGIHLDGTAGSTYLSFRDALIAGNQIANFNTYGVWVEGEGSAVIQNNLIDGDPLHVHSLRGAGGTWGNSSAHAAVAYSGGKMTVIGNTIRNVASVFNGLATDDNSWGNNTFCCDPAVSNGWNAGNVGIGSFANFGRYGTYQLVIEDGDPSSATFGKIKNVCLNGANAMPSSGKYVAGHFVRNAAATVSAGKILLGWSRLTNGNSHVSGADWTPVYGTIS